MELILLILVWDNTASWTASSKTENELYSLSLLLIFVWDEPASGTARSNIAELSYLISVLLLAVPEAVSSHTKTRSRSAVQSIPSLAPRCPRSSLVPYQSEVHQFCGALLTERTVCGMILPTFLGQTPHFASEKQKTITNHLHLWKAGSVAKSH